MLTLARLLSGSAEAAARRAARQIAQRGIMYALAGLFLLIGVAFLLGAVWIALAGVYSPLAASLILGGGAVVVGLIALAIGRQIGHRRSTARSASREAEEAEAKVRAEFADLAAAAKGISPTLPLVGAMILGFLLAGPRRRR